jgi:hypothetical protein
MNRHRRELLIALAAVSFTLVAAACGSLVKSSSAAASGDPSLKVAQCMRAHGVPNFPDPSPGGPSVIPNWINPQAPAFRSAQTACAQFFGGSGSPASSSESEKLELLNLSKCIRAHGLPSFPDPTTSPPPAPPPGSHAGNAIGIGGAYLVFPPQSPALTRVAAACGFRIP